MNQGILGIEGIKGINLMIPLMYPTTLITSMPPIPLISLMPLDAIDL